MQLNFKKTVALLLLSAFLAVNIAGNVFGCTECEGSDESQGVSTCVDKGCCTGGLINNHDDNHDAPALHQFGDKQHSSCFDCSTQQGSVVFSKRIKRVPTVATLAKSLNDFPLIFATRVKLFVGNLVPQPPTKTSQTLLAHRTVVLLH